jgi:hypothetical protein
MRLPGRAQARRALSQALCRQKVAPDAVVGQPPERGCAQPARQVDDRALGRRDRDCPMHPAIDGEHLAAMRADIGKVR